MTLRAVFLDDATGLLTTGVAGTVNPGIPSPTQSGMLGWTADPITGATAGGIPAGSLCVSRIIADSSGTANFILCFVGALGTGLTSCTFQVFDSAGTQVGTTGDVKSQVVSPAATGAKKITFTAGFTVTAGATYYASVVYVGGSGLQLRMTGAASPSGYGSDIVPPQRYGMVTGLSSPPASITPASLAANTQGAFWFGLKT